MIGHFVWGRFMKQHIRDLYDHVRTSSGVKQRGDEWEMVLRRVRNQLPLRVMSCCRIAGQMVSSCQVDNQGHPLTLVAEPIAYWTGRGAIARPLFGRNEYLYFTEIGALILLTLQCYTRHKIRNIRNT